MKLFSKKLLLILVVLLAFNLILVGCSSEEEEVQETQYLSLATGSIYYPIGGSIAGIISKEVPNTNATAQVTGDSVTNIRLIGEQELEFAILENDIASYAFEGENNFKDKAVKNMRGIATLYPEVIQIVVREGAGIETIEDLKGKKVAVGAASSRVEANAEQILANFNLTYDDIEENYLSFSEATTRLKDEQIDAAFLTAGVPATEVVDTTANQDIKLLGFSEDQIDNLHSNYPFLVGFDVPAGTYKGQDKEVNTVALKATFITEESIEESVVYNITKALFENKEQLVEAHSRAKDIDLESAQEGMAIPLHPGAKKYFDEVE
ncbi:MAG: TAXI family TRAP transporter solute-binding subunit [Bacillota bacterium]